MSEKPNVRRLLDENVVLRLWPETGHIFGLGRGSTFKAAREGKIPTIDLGVNKRRVPVAWIRKKLGID